MGLLSGEVAVQYGMYPVVCTDSLHFDFQKCVQLHVSFNAKFFFLLVPAVHVLGCLADICSLISMCDFHGGERSMSQMNDKCVHDT